MLKVVGVSRKYGRFEAVKDFSFTAQCGQVVGLLGQNGAGKSTLMNLIAGCMSPTTGRISISGHDLTKNPESAKHNLGYLPEIPPVYPELKVTEYLRFCCQLKDVVRNDHTKHIRNILQLVELESVQQQLVGNLSRGYRQRVGLAQALVGDPDVLLLDEPTTGFDPAQTVAFRSLIRKLAPEKLILLSSHMLGELESICNRVLIIHHGRLKLDHLLSDTFIHNPRYRLVVDTAPQKIMSSLRQLPSVYRTIMEGSCSNPKTTRLIIETKTNSNFPKELFVLLSGLNIPILELTPLEEKLEDLFLRATAQEGTEK